MEKVEKIEDIMPYGVMMTPALVVDGQVKSFDKALSLDEIKKFLVSRTPVLAGRVDQMNKCSACC